MDEDRELGKRFLAFEQAALSERWQDVRSLGSDLVAEYSGLSPNGRVVLLFNMAAACHSLYKEFPGGPRDTFSVGIPRPHRDLMFLLSALYWGALVAVFDQNKSVLSNRDSIEETLREYRTLFGSKLGTLIGAPREQKERVRETIATMNPEEAALLDPQIRELENDLKQY